MDFAAAAISVLLRCRPDDTWTPPLGVLFVRFLIAPWSNEVSFGYADDTNDPKHYRSIARIRDWSSGPDFGGNVDFAKGNVDTNVAVSTIVRRVAGSDDVEALLKLWDSRIAIPEWAESVASARGLCDKSKAMVAEAVLARAV